MIIKTGHSMPSARVAPQAAAAKSRSDWYDSVGLQNLLEKRLGMTPARVEATLDTARDLGKGLAVSWHALDVKVGKVLSHVPKVGEVAQESVTSAVVRAAGGLGYALAGIEGVAGLAKIVHGARHGSKTEMLGGALDLTAGAAIACTIAGAGALPFVLGPIAAGLGVARGITHAVQAYQKADPSKEVQGFLDSTRSAALMCSLLANASPVAAVAGAVLGPISVAVETCRGYVRVKEGLKAEDKKLQVAGLADLGTALGVTLSFCGLPLVGIPVMVGSQAGKLLYKLVKPVRPWVDKGLDVARLPLRLAVGVVEKTIDPAFNAVRRWINEHTPFQHGEDKMTETPAAGPE